MREVSGGNSPGAWLLLQGRGTSPGTACGPLRRNRPERGSDAVEGSILVAERATPEDVGRILASSGTLTLGGALDTLAGTLRRPSSSMSGKKLRRSQSWFGRLDRDGFIYRSWTKNRGIPHDQFDGRPAIGTCNTW